MVKAPDQPAVAQPGMTALVTVTLHHESQRYFLQLAATRIGNYPEVAARTAFIYIRAVAAAWTRYRQEWAYFRRCDLPHATLYELMVGQLDGSVADRSMNDFLGQVLARPASSWGSVAHPAALLERCKSSSCCGNTAHLPAVCEPPQTARGGNSKRPFVAKIFVDCKAKLALSFTTRALIAHISN